MKNKCKEAISEYENINLWMEGVTNDIHNKELSKFKDYSQAQMRKRHDYSWLFIIVAKCKNKIEKYHSEYIIKKNIKSKEVISTNLS